MLNARSLLIIVPALMALLAVTTQSFANDGPLFTFEYFGPQAAAPGDIVSLSPSVTYSGSEEVGDVRVQLWIPPFLEPFGTNSQCELTGRSYMCTFDGLVPTNSQEAMILSFFLDAETPCGWTLRSTAWMRSNDYEDEAFDPERTSTQFFVDCDGTFDEDESSASSEESSEESSSSSEGSSEESSSSSEESSSSSAESSQESSASSSESSEESSSSSAESSEEASSSSEESSEESSSSSAESSEESSSESSEGDEGGEDGGDDPVLPELPESPTPDFPGLNIPDFIFNLPFGRD